MLKNIGQLKNSINHIIESGANDIRFIEMIESYIERNYDTDWKVGDIVQNGMVKRTINSIDLCVEIDNEFMPIDTLKSCGYTIVHTPEITAETIALKFNVDVETVKLLLKKIK